MALEHLSDTAYWMAYMRSLESDRPDALFKDPYSRQLAGHLGQTVSERLGSLDLIATGIAVRTAVMDWLILDGVQRLNISVVLNIGSGLDTRPWRLSFPPRLTWIDVDLPPVLDHKAQTLSAETTTCQYHSIGLDILHSGQRRAMLEEHARTGHVLVVTEGLLVYLRPAEVQSLARDIHGYPACEWWLTDLVGPRALARLKQEWQPKVRNAEFHFAPADSEKFFADVGWREVEFHSSWHEGRRLRRTPPLPWLARLMLALSPAAQREEFRRLAGISVFARDTLPGKSPP